MNSDIHQLLGHGSPPKMKKKEKTVRNYSTL